MIGVNVPIPVPIAAYSFADGRILSSATVTSTDPRASPSTRAPRSSRHAGPNPRSHRSISASRPPAKWWSPRFTPFSTASATAARGPGDAVDHVVAAGPRIHVVRFRPEPAPRDGLRAQLGRTTAASVAKASCSASSRRRAVTPPVRCRARSSRAARRGRIRSSS